jgi:hypothetical protein
MHSETQHKSNEKTGSYKTRRNCFRLLIKLNNRQNQKEIL